MSYISLYYKNAKPGELAAIEELWEFAKSVEPSSTEGLSYGLPALKLNGRPLIGFSIATNHMTVYPFSPKIIEAVKEYVKDFETSKGLIRFTIDKVIPKSVIELMIELRRQELK